jgi:hypothetical protein
MKLILENNEGKAVRTFLVQGDSGYVISRKDTRRLELHASLGDLDAKKIKYDVLTEVQRDSLSKGTVAIPGNGVLRLVEDVGAVIRDEVNAKESSRTWRISIASMAVLMLAFVSFLENRPRENAKLEQELRQQVVRIVQKIPPKPKQVVQQPTSNQPVVETKTFKPTKQASIKRMGALSVLGSLKNGAQRGGVNLGAVNTTAGPGLGGTAGSGGVQTTLYGKGLVAAPIGAGSNMEGGGGYGTKGKGGGQAGYGKLSLIGSAGSSAIPLGKEALVEGGLDRDLIADVINRNMGQIRFCYEQALQGDPGLAGRVAVGFTIGSNGQVKVAGVENTTLNSKLVEDCILLRLKSWKFPMPSGGVDVKVSYPFVLRRAGQG